jgi:hypothetical protein
MAEWILVASIWICTLIISFVLGYKYAAQYIKEFVTEYTKLQKEYDSLKDGIKLAIDGSKDKNPPEKKG